MILQFSDADTFRLVLTGGFVPPEATLSEATVAFDPTGKLSIETDAKLTKKASTELTRLGVTQVKRHVAAAEPVSCWLQILPVIRDSNPPQLSSQAPVLFELENGQDLPVIVGEMLRLGNDRQGVRWLSDGETDKRVLLRVIGPPYYTLLRALDQTASGTKGTVRAYVEPAPRVWVQVGFAHPLASQVKLDAGQLLFVRPERDWTYLPDGPFRDVYEVLKFELPAAPVEWSEAKFTGKLNVPLRLVSGNAADAPELWVLRGDAVAQLDGFVRDADERLTQRLKFAVAKGPKNESVIVLRVTASKLAPPVLPLADVVGFKPFYKLPNLYLPAGARLHPPLRRDAVRKLLADDTDQLVWLYPGDDGTFTPETLPEDSFRPLEDWVEYVIETNHAPLAAWVEATQFDFEHFICADGSSPKPKDPGDGRGKRGKKGDDRPEADEPLVKTPAKKSGGGEKPTTPPTAMTLPPVEMKPPSEWALRRVELEDRFKAVEGPLDHPDRVALWPELAVANTGCNDKPEAAICWANGIWEQDHIPAEWVENWLRSELPSLALPVTAAEFDKLMKPADSSPVQMRHFVAVLLWLTCQPAPPDWLRGRLAAVQRHLEANESKLSVRAVWLAASRLAALAGADTLGLARVRDRLLQRLLDKGLDGEKDIPKFLKNAGLKDSARARIVQEKAIELHQQVRSWAEQSLKSPASVTQSDQAGTLAYIDLFFAYGLAKLGETTPALERMEAARRVLEGYKSGEDRAVAGSFLFRAFKYRIEQALAQKPHAGLLDPALLTELEQLHGKANAQPANGPFGLGYYVISRMREQSKILEPQEKLDPYADFMRHGDDLKKALAELPKIKDAKVFERTVRDLYRNGVGGKPNAEARFFVLHDALPQSARTGEAFTMELVALVPEAMKASEAANLQISEKPKKQGQLLERALFLAAHFDRHEVLQQLVDQFVDLVRAKPEEQRYELVNVVAAQCLRSLRKLGLRDEIDKLLRRLQDVVLGGQTVAQLRQKYRGKDPKAVKADAWAKVLQSLLNLAGGWLTFNLTEQAAPILEDARAELLGPSSVPLQAKDYTPLAQAYVSALGHGPADVGMAKIAELFRKMDPARVTNSFTTSKFYSRFHLNLVEETVLAVVSDDFALGPAGRRWLDEDEYLVRRRVHRDMKRHMDRSGL